MKESNSLFTLIPSNGFEGVEIMKDFDGMNSDFKNNEEKCMWMLSDGVVRFSSLNSFYETVDSSKNENKCLAMETTAAEAKRIGLKNLASVITCESLEHKAGMTNVLVSVMAPELKPSGPKPSLVLNNAPRPTPPR